MPATDSAEVISTELLAVLVCPVDKAVLRHEGDELICSMCQRRFPIVDGVPNMLIDDTD